MHSRPYLVALFAISAYQRKRDAEDAALVECTPHLHRSIMGLHEVVDQSQSESKSLGLNGARFPCPEELFKDAFLHLRRHAYASVSNFHPGNIECSSPRKRDETTCRRVANRI